MEIYLNEFKWLEINFTAHKIFNNTFRWGYGPREPGKCCISIETIPTFWCHVRHYSWWDWVGPKHWMLFVQDTFHRERSHGTTNFRRGFSRIVLFWRYRVRGAGSLPGLVPRGGTLPRQHRVHAEFEHMLLSWRWRCRGDCRWFWWWLRRWNVLCWFFCLGLWISFRVWRTEFTKSRIGTCCKCHGMHFGWWK